MGGKFSQQQVAHLKELGELTESSIKISSNGGRTLPRLKKKDLVSLLLYIWQQCPSYPEKGTLKLTTWTKLGEYFHATPRAPIQILTTWRVVMECLMIHHKFDVQQPVDSAPPSYESTKTTSKALYPVIQKGEGSDPSAPSCPCPPPTQQRMGGGTLFGL